MAENNPTLYRNKKVFLCDKCCVGCYSQADLDAHTKKHKKIPQTVVPRDPLPDFPDFPLGTHYFKVICLTCGAQANTKKDMRIHLRVKHEKTFFQIQEEMLSEKEKKKTQREKIPCTVCWKMIFADDYEHHLQSTSHQARERYEEGSVDGCDLCRIIISDFDPIAIHYSSVKHKIRAEYTPGSGCDRCKLDYSTIPLGMHQTRASVIANHQTSFSHRISEEGLMQPWRMPENFKGKCDICYVYLTESYDHFTSRRHRRVENIRALLGRQYSRAKSANF